MIDNGFSLYNNIELVFGSPNSLRYGYRALPKTPYLSHPSFDNEVFIIYRETLYKAQIEQACSKIFQKLMGYGSEVDIIKDDGSYYIVSRKINNFIQGCPLEHHAEVKGMAAIFILSYFLCEADMHSGNYGFQNNAQEKKAFRIDLADALDRKMFEMPLTLEALNQIPYRVEESYQGVCEADLPRDYVNSEAFQREKNEMIHRISNTPFEVFETILRETITDTFLADFADSPLLDSIESDSDEEEPSSHNSRLEKLVILLKKRHDDWKKLVLEGTLEQDYSYASEEEFQRTLDSFNQGSDDMSESSDEEDSAYSPHAFFGKRLAKDENEGASKRMRFDVEPRRLH